MGSTARSIDVAGRGAKWAGAALLGLALAPSAGAAPDRLAAGKPAYDKACGGCHQIGIGARNDVGPQLNGILGTPAGVVEGYEYSPRMKRSGVVWTAASLDDFIADPRGDMPGTRMMLPGVASAAQRQVIVAYIARYAADGHLKQTP